MKSISKFIKTKYTLVAIWSILIPITIMNFSKHPWVKPGNVIAWDVKSYYAYLPATFIHGDLSLQFIKGNPEYSNWFWPVVTPSGKFCIVTSMGMALLYLPFFLIAHLIALLGPYEADGYSVPYAFTLIFGALFYTIIGLIFLRKLLRYFFNELTVLFTLIAVFAGTNLLYYASWGGGMPHSYNFTLISIFLYLNHLWHLKPDIKKTILLGLTSGLITLIRPTNIIVIILIMLWNVTSWNSFIVKVKWLLKNYGYILIMAFCFFLVWIPQFAYWQFVSGKLFYFSYAEVGGKFFWDNPQFKNILISFRKGWFVYTPIMLIATLSIVLLRDRLKNLRLPILVFLLLNVYIQASWWCWWFGGSYGLRAFIDSYGIMAIPLAALFQEALKLKLKGILIFLIMGTLTYYNIFQLRQFNHAVLHYWWMSCEAYCEEFLRLKPTNKYWDLIPVPDYDKARKGIYVAKNLIPKYFGDKPITSKMIIRKIKEDLNEDDIGWGLKKRGIENGLSIDSMLTIKAWNIYEQKHNLSRYIVPLEDSLNQASKNPHHIETPEIQ